MYTELVSDWILEVFANLRKSTISLIMSACLSAYPSNPHGTTPLPWKDFHES